MDLVARATAVSQVINDPTPPASETANSCQRCTTSHGRHRFTYEEVAQLHSGAVLSYSLLDIILAGREDTPNEDRKSQEHKHAGGRSSRLKREGQMHITAAMEAQV